MMDTKDKLRALSKKNFLKQSRRKILKKNLTDFLTESGWMNRRPAISVVPQEMYLFNRSIRENLRSMLLNMNVR